MPTIGDALAIAAVHCAEASPWPRRPVGGGRPPGHGLAPPPDHTDWPASGSRQRGQVAVTLAGGRRPRPRYSSAPDAGTPRPCPPQFSLPGRTIAPTPRGRRGCCTVAIFCAICACVASVCEHIPIIWAMCAMCAACISCISAQPPMSTAAASVAVNTLILLMLFSWQMYCPRAATLGSTCRGSISGRLRRALCNIRRRRSHHLRDYSLCSGARRSRRALPTTDTDDRLIASAASIGLNSTPNTGYSTPAATGTPSAL